MGHPDPPGARPVLGLINAGILDMEPRYTRVRAAGLKASREYVEAAARVQALMDELLDRVADAGRRSTCWPSSPSRCR